jgi:integrase
LLFQFFLCTGCCEEEAMHAHYPDIDFQDGIYNVTIKKTWNPQGYKEREIPIPAHLVEALRVPKKTATSKLIFPTPEGKPNGGQCTALKARGRRKGACPEVGIYYRVRSRGERLISAPALQPSDQA